MIKSIMALGFIFIFCSALMGQTVIENPEKPLINNAGRVVELTELMQINDIGGEFFFKYPRNPKVSHEGHLFVQDYEQLLQFDSKGVFIRNYFKKGQGPGEMQEIGDYLLADKMLIVHDRRLFGECKAFQRSFRCCKLSQKFGLLLNTFANIKPGSTGIALSLT